MKISKDKPYVLHVAELIYLQIVNIKKENPGITNIDAVDRFIGSDLYKEISSGKFHDDWFNELKKNDFIDKKLKKKFPRKLSDY